MVGCIATKVGLKEEHCCSGQSPPLSVVLMRSRTARCLLKQLMFGLLGGAESSNDLQACLLEHRLCAVLQPAFYAEIKTNCDGTANVYFCVVHNIEGHCFEHCLVSP